MVIVATAVLALWTVNVVLEKGVIPVIRLTKGNPRQYDCGKLGKLVLNPEELEQLKNHPLVLSGTETLNRYNEHQARENKQHEQ